MISPGVNQDLFLLYLISLISCAIILSIGLLMIVYLETQPILTSIKLVWPYFYMVFVLVIRGITSLLLGSLPFIYILGSNVIILFRLSFVTWCLGFIGSFYLMTRFHHQVTIVVIFLLLFDSFVVLLRPVTLTLRVLINVSLGHYLIIILHLNLYLFVVIVWLVELFVYMVQSYVFLTLTRSYTTVL